MSGKARPRPNLLGIGANTNLEQISDWLTKIIVGVSLTQLASIKNGAAHSVPRYSARDGRRIRGRGFGGGVVIYFSLLGFILGWIYARLRLGAEMSKADALLALSRRAARAGDAATADAAKAEAQAIVRSAG